WPWTDQKIDTEVKKIDALSADLRSIRGLNQGERRAAYAKLAAEYPHLRDAQQNIDADLRYNPPWPGAIANHPPGYAPGTRLHDAVLERQAIVEALASSDDEAFRKAVAGLNGVNANRPRAQLEADLRQREAELSRQIHEATDRISPPSFLRVERRGPHLW